MAARILLLSLPMGSGPVRAAQAVELALRELDSQAIVKNVDVLQLDPTGFVQRHIRVSQDFMYRYPHKVAYSYERSDQPFGENHASMNDRFRSVVGKVRGYYLGMRFMVKPLVRLLQSEPWDLIVTTNLILARYLAAFKRQDKFVAPHFLVTTDFEVHRGFAGFSDHYFTATEEGAAYLQSLGVEAMQISVTGIPIHPFFARSKERCRYLESQELIGDRPILLQIASGFNSCATHMRSAAEVFKAVLAIEMPLEIVVVTGDQQQLKKQIEQIAVPTQHLVKLLGYTGHMDELMRVADIVLAKPGGLTVAEVLACGAVLAIINPLPGVETRNSDFLLENGAAIKINQLETLPYKLTRLLGDSQRLESLRTNARRLAKPQAAFEIAQCLLQSAERTKTQSARLTGTEIIA